MSGQKDNDKQISDEKEEEAVLSPLNDEQKFRFEEDILAISKRIRLLRGNPLLIMYYPDNMGRIVDEDIATVYEQFRRRGFSYAGKKIPELDVLLNTLGGSPDAAYMIAQSVRSFRLVSIF